VRYGIQPQGIFKEELAFLFAHDIGTDLVFDEIQESFLISADLGLADVKAIGIVFLLGSTKATAIAK